MNAKKEAGNLLLTRASGTEQIKTYFSKIHDLTQSGKEFPVNLEEVWPLVYSRKRRAIEVLKSDFVEGEDFNLHQKGQVVKIKDLKNGIATDAHLSVSCLEYFIAKRVKPVFEVYRKVFHKKMNTPEQKQLTEDLGDYVENQVIVVRMGSETNQIYVKDGVIFAKLSLIARYLDYYTTPTHLLKRLPLEDYIKVENGKQSAWFVNAKAFAEMVKTKGDVTFIEMQTIYRDVFKVTKYENDENPYTYMFTLEEMMRIFEALHKRPVNKSDVAELLTGGRKEHRDAN